MHFQDLSLCEYHPGFLDAGSWSVPLRAAGWLEHPHAFPKAKAPAGFISRLRTLLQLTQESLPHYQFRGVHECSVCVAEGNEPPSSPGWSQGNLLIPGDGEIFAAPGGVVHYVEDHRYAPPNRFVSAVLGCPDIGTDEYFTELRRVNLGQTIPLQSKTEFDAMFRRQIEATLKKREP